MRSAHTINLHNNKAKFSDSVPASLQPEGFRHKRALWTGINLFDHRVLAIRIEIARTDDYPVNVCFTIPALCNKSLRWTPAGLQQLTGVSSFQFANDFAIVGVTQLGDGWLVNPGPSVQEKSAIRGKLDLMRAIPFGQYYET